MCPNVEAEWEKYDIFSIYVWLALSKTKTNDREKFSVEDFNWNHVSCWTYLVTNNHQPFLLFNAEAMMRTTRAPPRKST